MKKVIKLASVLLVSSFGVCNAQSIGEIHNAGLKVYYEKYGYKDFQSPNVFSERILSIDKELYPQLFSEINDSDIKKVIDVGFGSDFQTFNYSNRVKQILMDAVASKAITSEFETLMNDMVANNYDASTCLAKIRDYKVGSDKERELLAIFEDVLVHSSEFWETNYTASTNDKKYKCKPWHQVSIADAAGSIIGGLIGFALTGPGAVVIGSVAGTVYSAAVQHGQDSVGGGCW